MKRSELLQALFGDTWKAEVDTEKFLYRHRPSR